MCTLPRNTSRAITPPISAAAMLSRKLDSTATITSSSEGALPVVGQERRHDVGQLALLEMARQQRKAHQQQEQVGEDHPLVLHVQRETAEARPELEAGEAELVGDDGGEPGQRHLQRVVVEQRDAEQRQREQDEVDGDAEEIERLGRWPGRGGQRRSARQKQRHDEKGRGRQRALHAEARPWTPTDQNFGRRENAACAHGSPRSTPPSPMVRKLAALARSGNRMPACAGRQLARKSAPVQTISGSGLPTIFSSLPL